MGVICKIAREIRVTLDGEIMVDSVLSCQVPCASAYRNWFERLPSQQTIRRFIVVSPVAGLYALVAMALVVGVGSACFLTEAFLRRPVAFRTFCIGACVCAEERHGAPAAMADIYYPRPET